MTCLSCEYATWEYPFGLTCLLTGKHAIEPCQFWQRYAGADDVSFTIKLREKVNNDSTKAA